MSLTNFKVGVILLRKMGAHLNWADMNNIDQQCLINTKRLFILYLIKETYTIQ